MTKAARLSGINDLQCFDHELDRTVNAGLDCPAFAPMFIKASNMVSTIRSSNNLYRELRDDQVGSVFSDCVRLHLLSVCKVGDVDRVFCTSCSSNTVCAHSVAFKYGMLKSLLANKRSVRRMCASDDDCCSALHDQYLSDAEWQIIEVSVCFQSR